MRGFSYYVLKRQRPRVCTLTALSKSLSLVHEVQDVLKHGDEADV